MKRSVLFLLYLLVTVSCLGQNLVPNGDFEQYDTCQTSISQLYRALYWTNPIQPITPPYSTPDYFNACNPNPNWSVPSNWWGYEPAHSGFAYAAIGTALDSTDGPLLTKNYREYLQTELTEPLEAGKHYCISFYVSPGDSFNYVCNDMQMFFSNIELHDTCHRCTLSYIPQLENTTNLSDRVGWTEISGAYLGQGGEKFIIIGNFKDSSSTIAHYTNWVTYAPNKNQALYYVDDVSIAVCDTTAAILSSENDFAVTVYPNPSIGIFYLKLKNDKNVTIEIFDALGGTINRKQSFMNKDSPINLSNYPDGIYMLKISQGYSSNLIKLIKVSP